MVRRAAVLACLGLMFVAAPQAEAASTIGQLRGPTSGGLYCEYGGTRIQTASPGNFYEAPYDGVVTSWTTENSWPTTFKVARLGSGSSYTVLASDGPRTGASSVSPVTHPVRFPVRQGDTIGVNIPYANYLCDFGLEGEIRGFDDANPGPGESGFFDEVSGGRVYVQARVERDRDGDGYGDDTQDACPSNPAAQGACPLPTTLGQTFTPEPTLCDNSTWVVTGSPGVVHAAPADGVITSWSHQAPATVGGTVEFEVLRPTGGNTYLSVGEDGPRAPTAGTLNTWNARIPIRQGDKIGLTAPGAACRSSSADWSLGNFGSDLDPGASGATSGSSSRMLDVSAVLEADADNDGYGDTSQDLCPTDATTQGQCRTVQPPDNGKCDAARKKLKKAKANLKKLKKKDAPAKKIKSAKKKVKRAKNAVKDKC